MTLAHLTLSQIAECFSRCTCGACGEVSAMPSKVELIVAKCAEAFNVTPAAMRKEGRSYSVRSARAVAMYLIRKNTQLSLSEVGTVFGKNHSSVYSSCDTMAARIADDPAFRALVEGVESAL